MDCKTVPLFSLPKAQGLFRGCFAGVGWCSIVLSILFCKEFGKRLRVLLRNSNVTSNVSNVRCHRANKDSMSIDFKHILHTLF